jgi:predicted transcriptional regulator
VKVHILISGWDKERAIWGCMHLGADKIYIVIPNASPKKEIEPWVSSKTKAIADDIKRKYSKYFQIEFLPVIYEDYLDCFKKVIRVIKKENGNEIFVNISSGSHVAASAAIFAASLMKCKAYYVLAEKYDEVFQHEDRFISYGGKSVVEVPLLPVSSISGTEIEILKIIKKDGKIAVSELAKKANTLFTIPTRSKFNYYVCKLADSGFLENKIISGKMYTKITASGKMITEAFT